MQKVLPNQTPGKRFFREIAFDGQGGIIALAVVVLIFLVIGGGSLAMLKNASAQKTIVDERSLQSYYVAMAGVQEALATRMYPSSNALVWWRPNRVNAAGLRVTPLFGRPAATGTGYPDEGIVCQTAQASGQPCPTASIIGAYRYFVLNGDQGVNAGASTGTTVSYWADSVNNAQGQPVKIAPQAFYTDATNPNLSASEFIVVSKGYTCVPANGGNFSGIALPGALIDTRNSTTDGGTPTGTTGFLIPSCQASVNGIPVRMDTTTLVTRVIIDPDSGQPDRIVGTRLVKDDTNITVAGSRKVFIPGTGWTNAAFSFEPVFSYFGGTAANPATPGHIVFYDFVKNQITCSVNITGTTTDLRSNAACAGIGPKTVMQLYFLGPIDHRSIDPMNNFSFEECTDDTLTEAAADRCNIQVNNLTSSQPELGYQLIFEPPKSNQIKLLPNLQSLPSGAQNYEIVINTRNLRSWTGSPGPTGPYRIQFRVN